MAHPKDDVSIRGDCVLDYLSGFVDFKQGKTATTDNIE